MKRIPPNINRKTTIITQKRIWCNCNIMLMILITVTAVTCTDILQSDVHLSISQISPKSSEYIAGVNPTPDDASQWSISHTSLSSVKPQDEMLVHLGIVSTLPSISETPHKKSTKENQSQMGTHRRIERSAQPILNEHLSRSSFNNVDLRNVKQNELSAGRQYVKYNIKPTGTSAATDTVKQSLVIDHTQRVRQAKTLATKTPTITSTEGVSKSSSFLSAGGPRPDTSGSPISPSSTINTAISMTATATATVNGTKVELPHNGRQNPSPDIQEIITGIVKLLNGNVNVHANTQGLRRPTASRINNRGPPRISEAQTLPVDYDIQKPPLGSSMRPPPYPFDRPDRPFITGVPIPEQIVPYRPNFVSGRPPWYRHKPRPPITTTLGGAGGGGGGNIRRPIPQYKPLPASSMNPPQSVEEPEVPQRKQQPPSPPANHRVEEEVESTAMGSVPPKPTDTTYDSEFSNEEDDKNTQYIEVSENESGTLIENEPGERDKDLKPPPPSPSSTSIPPKKEEHKKKPSRHKTNDRKKLAIVEYTTITDSNSVSTSAPSTYIPISIKNPQSSVSIDSSMEEVIFMTTSRTPTLETASTMSATNQTPNMESTITSSSSPTIITTPISTSEMTKESTRSNSMTNNELKVTIAATPSSSISSTTSTITKTKASTASTTATTTALANSTSSNEYQPRPGIVLDDPEFKPGGRPRPQQRHPQQQPSPRPTPTVPHQIHSTRSPVLPPGYGEIFDVTLSAIQGPGSGGGSQQTINIKPYGVYDSGNAGSPPSQADIIVSGLGDDGFVSIDGKRTYINLFGDPTDPPGAAKPPTTTASTTPAKLPGSGSVTGIASVGDNGNEGAITPSVTGQKTGNGFAVPETEIVELKATQTNNHTPVAVVPQSPTTLSGLSRPHYRPRTTQPPVRIDTCIVGDDSTCDQAQHERCKTENGVSSCHCRPGYSRRKHREPCRRVISFFLSLRVDRIYDHRIVWDKKFLDRNTEPYSQLSYESIRAIDSAMSMTPYSDEFMKAKVNNIYRGEQKFGGSGVFVNLTIKLDESVEALRTNLRSDVQKHLLGVIHRRNNNIGNSVLYVSTPEGSVSPLHDLDECQSPEYNDCHSRASCSNLWGSFRCVCEAGLRDPWSDQPQRSGRECQTCPDAHCNNHGSCSYNNEAIQECVCDSGHYGSQCEIDGEVLGVAIGASVAAVIIIVLTLVCLIMWSRRWQYEQKNALGSPVFGYMNPAPLKSAGALAQPGYQVTLEDRMRWAQIADVMAQTGNHYGAEPIAPTRPSSAMFAYPNLQAMGMSAMEAMTATMQSNMQMHQNATLPPVPLPRRLGLSSRSNGMRTLENSSSSEEEDRADLLGRNFQVPRPKSRSNASIANQSGIYYDVDYEPSGNGIGNTSVDHLYSSQNQSSSHPHTHGHSHSNHIPGPQGIPMSTYTAGRAPSSYYMK